MLGWIRRILSRARGCADMIFFLLTFPFIAFLLFFLIGIEYLPRTFTSMLGWIHRSRFSILVIMILVMFFIAGLLHSLSLNEGYSIEWEINFWLNFSTEIVGGIVAFGLFEIIVEGRIVERERIRRQADAIGRLKKAQTLEERQLIAEEMSRYDLFRGANLYGANLAGIRLIGSMLVNDFRMANLSGANLTEIKISLADFTRANLSEADLTKADLFQANFSKADLAGANLFNADLAVAKFGGCILFGAHLSQAILRSAKFDNKTVLPDAKAFPLDRATEMFAPFPEDHIKYSKYWMPITDMTLYTDPNNPQFWQPSWVKKQDRDKKSFAVDFGNKGVMLLKRIMGVK